MVNALHTCSFTQLFCLELWSVFKLNQILLMSYSYSIQHIISCSNWSKLEYPNEPFCGKIRTLSGQDKESVIRIPKLLYYEILEYPAHLPDNHSLTVAHFSHIQTT